MAENDDRRQRAPRRWKDMGGGEKYALIQSQVLMWALVLVVAYLLATKLSAVLGLATLAVLIAVYAFGIYRIRRGR